MKNSFISLYQYTFSDLAEITGGDAAKIDFKTVQYLCNHPQYKTPKFKITSNFQF